MAEYGQREIAQGTTLIEQVTGHVHAAAAASAGTGTHGQLGHGVAPGLGGLADIVIGDSVTDADVHVDWTDGAAGLATLAI